MGREIKSFFEIPQRILTKYYDDFEMDGERVREQIWQLSYRDLRSHELVLQGKSELSELCFNEETIFPEQWVMPAGEILHAGKKDYIRNQCKLTGKGIKVAVIDRPMKKDHIEFQNKLTYLEVLPGKEENQSIDFHGTTCASFLAGNTCGVAPEAELFFFALPNYAFCLAYSELQLKALQMILDYNFSHKETPIRIVSISAAFAASHLQRRAELVNELFKTGCTVLDATMFMKSFGGIDFNPYARKECGEKEYSFAEFQKENFERNKERPGFIDYFNNCCYIPSARRTSASEDIDNGYIFWGKKVSESYTIPQAAGAFALCLEKNPEMTYLDFVAFSKGCSRKEGFIILDLSSL